MVGEQTTDSAAYLLEDVQEPGAPFHRSNLMRIQKSADEFEKLSDSAL